MAINYAEHVSRKQTPQSEPIPGQAQIENSAGGFVYAVDDWTRLDRFLILGAEGGSYYATERELTKENASCVERCAILDPKRTVDHIVEISRDNRAPKNDPAIFALALCASQTPYTVTGGTKAEAPARQFALDALPIVCRTAAHLYQFVAAVDKLRGWGRGLRNGVQQWFMSKLPRELALQASKYQQRDGWAMRDVMRLAHFNRKLADLDQTYRDIYWWVTKGWEGVGEDPHPNEAMLPIWAFEKAKRASTVGEIVHLINEYDLVREVIPTQWLKSPEVWDALLVRMPATAMLRNLATMTRVGLLAPLSAATKTICARLESEEWLKKGRIHPYAVLVAMLTYKTGRSHNGDSTWAPVSQVCDALDGAFYKAFGAVESTGKRWLLGLDVSGSMDSSFIAGGKDKKTGRALASPISARVASAAMAMVTAAAEPQHHVIGFTSGGWTSPESLPVSRWGWGGPGNGVTPLTISPRRRLDDICHELRSLPMGGTDCALPMLYAEANKIEVDTFVVYTDSETWAGGIHPSQALRRYRQTMGIPAKLVVVGMVSNGFSIADPNDGGMMDVCGFDTATPQVMSEFAKA